MTRLFCQISSIRGISKIHSAKTKFEKCLWTGFVSIMTCILLVTMIFLIQDYIQYTTAWHTTNVLDYPSPFPAITLCSQNPFSLAANKYWLNRSIMSPSELQDNLTITSLSALNNPDEDSLGILRLYDLFSTYYMNLSPNDTIKLSHSENMIRYCILIYKNDIIVAENCNLTNEKFFIRLFSHQEYFNCYTIEGNEVDTTEVVGLILLVQLTPSQNIPELENSFLIDILQRGEGLKVVVHEPRRFPDIENSGINMHPAKMNSLVYYPTEWQRLSTPKRMCRHKQKGIFDLNRKFKYTFTQCVSSEIQREIIKNCGCMLSNIPRPFAPNASVPYCIKLVSLNETKVIMDRFLCVDDITSQSIEIRKKIEQNQCILRCKYMTYETTMSLTKWTASELKLNQLENLYRSYIAYRQYKTKENVDKIKKMLKESLQKSIELRKTILYNHLNNITKNQKVNDDSFTYISLTRKNFDINIKTEKLVLDSNTLLSRIGGLTSICIGLTAAVFAEFIEFIYLIHKRSCSSNIPEESNETEIKTNAFPNLSNQDPLLKMNFDDDEVKSLNLNFFKSNSLQHRKINKESFQENISEASVDLSFSKFDRQNSQGYWICN